MDIETESFLSAITRDQEALDIMAQMFLIQNSSLQRKAISLFVDWNTVLCMGSRGNIWLSCAYNPDAETVPKWLMIVLDLKMTRKFIARRHQNINLDEAIDHYAQRFVEAVCQRDPSARFFRGRIYEQSTLEPLEEVLKEVCNRIMSANVPPSRSVSSFPKGRSPYHQEDIMQIGQELIPEYLLEKWAEASAK